MHEEPREEDLTAYALGELDGEARTAVEEVLARSAACSVRLTRWMPVWIRKPTLPTEWRVIALISL